MASTGRDSAPVGAFCCATQGTGEPSPCVRRQEGDVRAFVLIGLGGVLGANARYLVSVWAANRWGVAFPYGTLLVNATGSFLIGFVLALVAARFGDSAEGRLLVVAGFLGAYTTFSTFAFETVALSRQRAHWPAL